MQVFKAYFKIIRNRLPMLSIYLVVFVVVSIIITNMMGTGAASFSASKGNVVIFNEDAGSPIADGLAAYIRNTSNIVDIPDDRQSVEDALFGGNIDYVLRIPSGFSSDFMAGGGAKLTRTAAGGSVAGVYLDLLVDKYLGIAELYTKNARELTADQITAYVAADLQKQAVVTTNNYGKAADTNSLVYYFQYLAYPILAVMIIGVTTFMMAFGDKDVSNRNLCSPIKPFSMNMQIVLGNVIFALGAWAAMCAMVFIAYGKLPQGTGVVLLCANALVMTISSLAIGFLAGKFVRDSGVQSAVANVVSLGISFISGVFVPQELLGQTVLNIARFMPGYWYVKATRDISGITVFDWASLEPVLLGMLVQLGFAAVFFLVAFAASKQMRQNKLA